MPNYFVLYARFIAICSIAISTVCFAQTSHELFVGAQKEQICSEQDLVEAIKYLQIIDINDIRSSACKNHPVQPSRRILAIAYDSGKLGSIQDIDELPVVNIAILVFEKNTFELVSSYRDEMTEHATLRFDEASLWIDTANYKLNDTTRAIGLHITSGYISHCFEGGAGAALYLFVEETDILRNILSDLSTSEWTFISRGPDRCSNVPEGTPTIIEYFQFYIHPDKISSNGYADLIITGTASRDDEKPSKRAKFSYRLKYNGNKYLLDDYQDAYWKWRE